MYAGAQLPEVIRQSDVSGAILAPEADVAPRVSATGPGHVSTVAPDTGQKLPGYGPIIANVGYRNGDMHLDYVFTKNDMPNVRFYTPNQ